MHRKGVMRAMNSVVAQLRAGSHIYAPVDTCAILRERTVNEYTVFQGDEDRGVPAQAEDAGPQALPAGADAGTPVPVQSRLQRLRQDRLPRSDPQPPPVGRRVP